MTILPYDVVGMRRVFHAFPEPAFLEYRTASLVAQRLSELGFDVRTGADVMDPGSVLAPPQAQAIDAAKTAALDAGADQFWLDRMDGALTGVVGELRRGPGPIVALRVDMDALPVTETPDPTHAPNIGGYSSSRAGLMHACGHDGHTAMGLATAAAMAAREDWYGTLRLIFQPAEEGGRGAQPMVAAGIVDDVDWFFAMHLGCGLPSGNVALQATDFLFSQKIDVQFHGVSAHAAMAPENGANALLAAAYATTGLYALPRHGSAITHVNVGRLEAGSTRNAIASHALMQMEIRASTRPAFDHMSRSATRVLQGAAMACNVTVDSQIVGHGIGITSDDAACALVEQAARAIAGIDVTAQWPIGGGDDATFMMQRVQERGGKACYFLVGCDLFDVHHACNFDIDESSLLVGVAILQGVLFSALNA